jgi:hypothetical protein
MRKLRLYSAATGLLLLRFGAGARLAITMATALQKKNLTALTTLPGKHAELRVNTFLQETLTGDTCQFDFSAVGTSLLSLAHPFPQRQTTALDDLTISRWVASRVQFRKAFPRASAMPNQGLHSRFGKSEDL